MDWEDTAKANFNWWHGFLLLFQVNNILWEGQDWKNVAANDAYFSKLLPGSTKAFWSCHSATTRQISGWNARLWHSCFVKFCERDQAENNVFGHSCRYDSHYGLTAACWSLKELPNSWCLHCWKHCTNIAPQLVEPGGLKGLKADGVWGSETGRRHGSSKLKASEFHRNYF